MRQRIICPQCGVPTVGTDGPSSTSGDAVCPQCGESLLRDVPAALRITTVLCIDDDPLVLSFYRDFLDRHAYRVLMATDGLLGIELARRERPLTSSSWMSCCGA